MVSCQVTIENKINFGIFESFASKAVRLTIKSKALET